MCDEVIFVVELRVSPEAFPYYSQRITLDDLGEIKNPADLLADFFVPQFKVTHTLSVSVSCTCGKVSGLGFIDIGQFFNKARHEIVQAAQYLSVSVTQCALIYGLHSLLYSLAEGLTDLAKQLVIVDAYVSYVHPIHIGSVLRCN